MMSSRLKIVALVLSAVILAGCSVSPYPKSTIGGGYSETQLEPGVWRVRYWASRHASSETVQTYWLERAAELTGEQGFEGFEIISNVHLSAKPDQPAFPEIQIAAASFIYVPATPSEPSRELEADIRLLHHPFATRRMRTFDAAKLLTALEPFVKGPKCNNDNVCGHLHRYLYEP
jgi:hypothetical protein